MIQLLHPRREIRSRLGNSLLYPSFGLASCRFNLSVKCFHLQVRFSRFRIDSCLGPVSDHFGLLFHVHYALLDRLAVSRVAGIEFVLQILKCLLQRHALLQELILDHIRSKRRYTAPPSSFNRATPAFLDFGEDRGLTGFKRLVKIAQKLQINSATTRLSRVSSPWFRAQS